MMVFLLVIASIVAYLLGSIPTSVWIGKWFRGIDVRDYGSGNAGATNTMRVLGVALGIPVVIIDIAKGFLAVQLSFIHSGFLEIFPDIVVLQLILGAFAVLGHIYPVFAGFRGGKGVATLFGVILAVHPAITLMAIGVFLVVLLMVKIVSVSSMVAGISFPVFLFLFYPHSPLSLKIFSVAVAILLLYTHRTNIRRLVRKEEPRATFLFGEKKRDEGKLSE